MGFRKNNKRRNWTLELKKKIIKRRESQVVRGGASHGKTKNYIRIPHTYVYTITNEDQRDEEKIEVKKSIENGDPVSGKCDNSWKKCLALIVLHVFSVSLFFLTQFRPQLRYVTAVKRFSINRTRGRKSGSRSKVQTIKSPRLRTPLWWSFRLQVRKKKKKKNRMRARAVAPCTFVRWCECQRVSSGMFSSKTSKPQWSLISW